MGTQQIGLRDVKQGAPQSNAKLLAPLRYLMIFHEEKTTYDFVVPGLIAVTAWLGYSLLDPKPPIFGDAGLLRFVRDLLIMAVPFMIGSLAAVAMGATTSLDRRPTGVELYLDGRLLTLRAFVCYLLGYLSFLGIVTLGLAVLAGLLHDDVIHWTLNLPLYAKIIRSAGELGLSVLLSALSVTVFWALYFLTDIVNRP